MRAEVTRVFRISVSVGLASAVLIATSVTLVGSLFPIFLALVAGVVVFQYPLDDPGGLELPGFLDRVVLFGGVVFLLISGTWSTFTGGYGTFFLVITVFMSAGAVLLPWRGGISLYTFTGVFGVLFALQLDVVPMVTFGGPLYLAMFVFTAVWRYEDELDESLAGEDIPDVLAMILAYAMVIGIPMFGLGTVIPTLQPDWTKGSLGDGSTGPIQPEPADSFGLELLVLAIGLILLSVACWWLWKKLSEDEEEITEQVEMPGPEGMDVEKAEVDSSVNLRPVVRGGRKADVLKLLHDLLDRLENTKKQREDDETIQEFVLGQFTPEPLNRRQATFVSGVYTGARYGYREPDPDEFRQYQELLEAMRDHV